jgi:hypothetical protein
MRTTNGAASRTGRTATKGALGIALAGGTAFLVLTAGGIAMASPLPGPAAAHTTSARPGWNRVSNAPGATSTGNGKSGRPPAPTPAPIQGQPGWNRVSNTPGATGAVNGKGGRLPGSTPAPGQDAGGAGGNGGLLPGSAPGTGTGGAGGPGGLFPGSAPAPGAGTGGAGGQA